MKPLVYVASAYTGGRESWNTHFQCRVFHQLLAEQLVTPLVPLWSHLQELIFPSPYEDWLTLDFEYIKRCDALLRLEVYIPELNYVQSESPGADREVEHARSLGIPVFFSIEDLYSWARTQRTDAELSQTMTTTVSTETTRSK